VHVGAHDLRGARMQGADRGMQTTRRCTVRGIFTILPKPVPSNVTLLCSIRIPERNESDALPLCRITFGLLKVAALVPFKTR